MDNTGDYVTYGELLLALSDAGSNKVTKTATTLSNKVVDVAGDTYEFTGTINVGDVIEQAGFVDCVIEKLTTPARIRIIKTGVENPIANGAANVLTSATIPKRIGEEAIKAAMDFIDNHTQRFFNKRTGTFEIEGTNTILLQFGVPIIEITKLDINNSGQDLIEGDDDDFIAYKGRAVPQDDRWNPKIKLNVRNRQNIFTDLLTNRVFLYGHRTIIDGSFGFLEPDGTTPRDIKRATMLIALNRIKIPIGGETFTTSGTVRRLKVDLHEQEFFEIRTLNRGYPLTSNAEINNIIARFRVPFTIKGSIKFITGLNHSV